MLWIKETHINATKSTHCRDVDWHETEFKDDELRLLLKHMIKEFGRVRSMWRNTPDGKRQVGWVFEKRVEYDGTRPNTPAKERTYLHETRVEVSIGDPRQSTPTPIAMSPWA